ncbi:MAG: hypothetical protein K0R00_2795, partial [Herbinix sp.]|nr:hypothetical protein [Herbinix sp.]
SIRGRLGIPRVLNMFEDYPFWFTLFTRLGFKVIISKESSKKLYNKGLETIPSESACYPAKLCHGHIIDLIEQGITTIFYPSIVYEKKEFKDASNHYNCPVVISYPEVIRNHIDEIRDGKVTFLSPFLSLDNDRVLVSRGVVLCGKPYHVDPEINHGIPELISSFGLAVLTEDSVAHLSPLIQKLRVVDQWVYNSRLYRAASLVAKEDRLDLIQLNSFGCGLDAVTSDQIAELLATGSKIYTMLKIDEGNNLGAAKIRIRSLIAAMEERERQEDKVVPMVAGYEIPPFTRKMKRTHTILAPQMSPIHFDLLQEAMKKSGYTFVVLPAMDKTAVDEGLKYVNNDACYPAIIMIGQLVQALKSGNYDCNHTSVIITQSGGGCRATNYIAFLKLGLKQAGFGNVPIISLNTLGMEKQPGFKISLGMINRAVMGMIYGDLFMRLLYRTRPYERFPGSAQLLYEKWSETAKSNLRNGSKLMFRQNIS